ncbi:MAG: hypothetical protein GY805_14870, partial [Chloroflexi bacterium]|nr:hypothetical protein [Chloroflexota bacterium]
VHNYERETGLVGVDPEGSYFPRTVAERPSASPLEADFQAKQVPQRFDTAVLPPGSSVESIQYDNLSVTVHLTTPKPFTARYQSFDFPGWTAAVDGSTVPITPEKPSGLITFPVPAGQHTLTVQWQSTPSRTILLGLSLMALAGVAVVVLVLARTEYSVFSKQYSASSKPTDYRSLLTDYWPLLTLAVLLILGKIILDRSENPLRRITGPTVEQTAVLQAAELQLQGYNLNKTAVASGDIFDIDLAWTATDFPQARYQSNVWLLGSDGLVWSDLDTQRPRLYEDMPPTLFWQPGQWGWDSREVQVLRGTPPGQYDIVLTLFDLTTLQPLIMQDAAGAIVGSTAVIGQIQVAQPEPAETISDGLGIVSNIMLLEYRQDRLTAVPGDVVLHTFFWQRSSALPSSNTFNLQLLDDNDEVVFQWERPFSLPNYPATAWQNNEQVRGQHLLRLPAGLNSGSYHFVTDGLLLGEIVIEAPVRLFEPIEMKTAVSTTFHKNEQPLITLIGLTQSSIVNQQSSIDLLWRAEAEMPTSYRVFIHLVADDGQIIVQSDGEPVSWSRPTTGWVTGEYILDVHSLTLPSKLPANVSLRIGLYDPATNERLQTETAAFATILFHPKSDD